VLSKAKARAQGIACLKALQDHTDTTKAAGDARCRDQIMADTLVERITGQAHASDVNAELQIMMDLDTLLDANEQRPAELAGYGPLPADMARHILSTSKGRLWWRRLYAAPVGGPIVGGDPYRRRFDGFSHTLIMARDRHCRDPFCDAPIRHIDHIERYADGGLTIHPNGLAYSIQVPVVPGDCLGDVDHVVDNRSRVRWYAVKAESSSHPECQASTASAHSSAS